MTDSARPEKAGDEESPAKPERSRLWRRLRTNFLAGVLVTAPIGITFYLAWLVIDWIDNRVTPMIPHQYNPESYLPFTVPGLGVLIVFVVLTVVGAFATGMLGRWAVGIFERILARMPVIRSLYGATKQIVETILKQQSNAFREVVLFEYPRPGSWALGFITGITSGEIQNLTEDEVLNVFLPTTPNPTSGYLLFLPKKDLLFLDMTVEEGIKMVVSGGIVTPPDRRPLEVQGVPKVASVEGKTEETAAGREKDPATSA